jgi:hypothetical protein
MSRADGQEEQFVLRVVDPAVADQLRAALREEPGAQLDALQLQFPGAEPAVQYVVS